MTEATPLATNDVADTIDAPSVDETDFDTIAEEQAVADFAEYKRRQAETDATAEPSGEATFDLKTLLELKERRDQLKVQQLKGRKGVRLDTAGDGLVSVSELVASNRHLRGVA